MPDEQSLICKQSLKTVQNKWNKPALTVKCFCVCLVVFVLVEFEHDVLVSSALFW
jgi:hypothetical protein